MGLLATCPKCSTTYVAGQACPGCAQQQGGGGGTGAPAEATEVMQEYARRQEAHTLAYAAFMSRAMAGGLVGLLGAIAFSFLLFCGGLPLWFIAVSVFLILFAAAVAVFSHTYMLKNKEALEIHCPACDARLDEMPLNEGCCPGCQVKLR